ncbi:MAG: (5-formylfuran-3-yl)methyl phosphate synthase [Elusimicrobiota bacterium]|nr:(5-formylfuran-3-yl)methyl phosphate synthase [Elusimicrobiota bacterium]
MTGTNKIKLLVSPIDVREAGIVARAGVDILDLKNVKEGSLGANFPWVLKDIISKFSRFPVKFSAAIGDLDFKPGSAALSAYAAASLGADYVKAGLYGVRNEKQAFELSLAVVKGVKAARPRALAVISGYADWRRFGGLAPWPLVRAAKRAGADAVMLDTAIKDGRSLFDNMTNKELSRFLSLARAAGIKTALAGSIRGKHLAAIRALGPDIVGLRGAVCLGEDRSRSVCPLRLAAIKETCRA